MTDSWHSHIYAVLRRPNEPHILLIKDGDGWFLPYGHHVDDVWSSDANIATDMFGKQLDAEVWTLRCVHYSYSRDEKWIEAVFELILLDETWFPPPNTQWVDWSGFQRVPFPKEALRPKVDAYLKDLAAGDIPPQRPPWARLGWLPEVRVWIDSELRAHGRTLQSLEQVKQWGISCVLRAKTDGPDFYLKVPDIKQPLFVNEATVTKTLAALFPEYVPPVLSIDAARNWLLLPDFGELTGDSVSLEAMIEIQQQLASLQIESVKYIDQLLAAGCMDRRLDFFLAHIDLLVENSLAIEKLTEEQRADLRLLVPDFKALCQKLAAYKVPFTLVHGDLYLGNTASMNGKIIFFDWTDACIAHPFVDPIDIYREKDDEKKAAILRGYLEMWTDYEPIERLLEMWPIAEIVYRLHQAISYAHIVPALEPDSRHELDVTHYILADLIRDTKAYLKPEGE